MALQSSGPISINNIATEFGGTVPHAINEYYKGGGLVPSTIPEAVTASSLTGSYAPNKRQPAISGYDPQINSFNRLYTHALWGDNGSTGSMDMSFNVSKTGTYNYYFGWFIQNANTFSGNTYFYANGSLKATHNLYTTSNNTNSVTGTLSLSAGQTIRVRNDGFPSAGWSAHTVYIGGSTYNNAFIDSAANANIPTSGVIAFNNFYNGTST
jgi:hypothetical protein